MQLIPYEQFAKLRLRDFVPDDTAIGEAADWEWMGSRWHNEGIGFTSFSRHASTPDATGGVEISFSELPQDCIERLLSAIGLPVRPGMSISEVLSVLGSPRATRQFVADRHTYEFTAGTPQPYVVSCTVTDGEGLTYVTAVRPDLVNRDE